MKTEPLIHAVHRSLNKPLTFLGVERKLFIFAAALGAATFNFFGSVLGGLAMFAVLYASARLATAHDPEMLRIVLNASKFKAQYDPAKYAIDQRKRA